MLSVSQTLRTDHHNWVFFFNSFPYKVPKIKEDSLGSTVMSRFMQTFISTSGVSLARTMARSIFFFLFVLIKTFSPTDI